MRVIILTSSVLKRFRRLGGDDDNCPRLPMAYPFYGYLKENHIDVELFSLKSENSKEGYDGESITFSNYLKVIPYVKYLNSFDFIITLGTLGSYISLILSLLGVNNKVISLVFANYSPGRKGVIGKLKNSIVHIGMQRSKGLMYMTQEQLNQANSSLKFPIKKLYYLPIGVDTKFFSPLIDPSNFLVRKEILALSNVDYVVVAGDQLRDEIKIAKIMEGLGIKLVRLTQSSNVEKLWQNWAKANNRGIDVFCKAGLSFQEVRYIYQHAICVLNMVNNTWQPAGYTVATEAMASGTPVIMSSGLSTRELKSYQHDPPCFIEIDLLLDISLVRQELSKLITNNELRKNLSIAGRKFVGDNLRIEVTGKALVSILRNS